MLMLYVLVCVLLTVVSVKYLILPANDNYKKEQKSYNSVQTEYEKLEQKISKASAYKASNERMAVNINELKSGFQPLLADEDIDKLITDLIYKNSMKTEMLYINKAVEYSEDSLKAVQETTQANIDNAQPTTSVTTTTATTTTTTTSENKKNAQDDKTEKLEENVKISSVNVTVNGKYVNFVNLINNIKSTKGMTVSDVNFSTDDNASPMSNIVVSFSVKIYMYDDSRLNEVTANQQS